MQREFQLDCDQEIGPNRDHHLDWEHGSKAEGSGKQADWSRSESEVASLAYITMRLST